MKKKMLIVHHCGNIGGAGNSLLLFLSCVDTTEYEIVVYTKSSDSKKMYELLQQNSNITVKESGEYPAIFNFYSGNEKILINPWNFINHKNIKKTEKYMKEIVELEKPDVLVLNTMTLAYLGKTFKDYPFKKVIFDRETFGKEIIPVRNCLIQRDLREYFDKVVYLSKYDMNCVKGNNGVIITDKYEQVEVKEDVSFSADTKNILFVGGNSLIKGISTAIQTMCYLPKDYVLHIIGCKELINSEMKKNWRTLNPFSNFYHLKKLDTFIEENNLKDRIKFYGAVTNPESYMKAADILIVPTIKQHQSRPFIEAGFLKTPVIDSNMPCMQDFIHNEENCLSFKIDDAKELSNCILKLEDNNLREKLINNQYELVEKNFNLNDYYNEIKQMLNSIEK